MPAARWVVLRSRLRHYAGSLPELLAEVSAARPEAPDPTDATNGPGGFTA
ncbi:hypothetical protein [Streptomyces nojiriensis]